MLLFMCKPFDAKSRKKEPRVSRDELERRFGDRMPDEAEEDAPEKTYRDGSAVNECWNAEREGF